MVLSQDADARSPPSGEDTTVVTLSECSLKVIRQDDQLDSSPLMHMAWQSRGLVLVYLWLNRELVGNMGEQTGRHGLHSPQCWKHELAASCRCHSQWCKCPFDTLMTSIQGSISNILMHDT